MVTSQQHEFILCLSSLLLNTLRSHVCRKRPLVTVHKPGSNISTFCFSLHSAAPVTTLIQINPIHAFPSHCLKIHFNIILRSKSRSSTLSLSLRSPHPNPVHNSRVSLFRISLTTNADYVLKSYNR